MSTAVISYLPDARAARLRIAAPIKAHLAVAGISGAELSRRIGIDQAQISRRLSGKLTFTADDLVAIANELNLTLPELLQMPKDPPIGGGTTLHGVGTLIERRIVGRTGLEPVTDGLRVAPVTPIFASVPA